MTTIFHDSYNDPTSVYKISNLDTGGDIKYFGYLDKDGNWYIMQLTSVSSLYIKGTSDYETNWTNRAISLNYDYFHNVF